MFHFNTSYRFLSLLVITGVFVFIFWKEIHGFVCFAHIIRLWLLLDFISCCPNIVFSFQVYFQLGLTNSGCNPGPWTLFSTFSWKVLSLSLISLFEFTLPQVHPVFTFIPSVKERISKVVGIGFLPLFTLLWDSVLTRVLVSHLLPNASKVQADPQLIVQHKTVLDGPQFRQEEQNCHLCPGLCTQANIAYGFASRYLQCECFLDAHQNNSHHINSCIVLKPASCCFWPISQQKLMPIHWSSTYWQSFISHSDQTQ